MVSMTECLIYILYLLKDFQLICHITGDGSLAYVKYMKVDTIQLVWTHDCEHGVINGFDLSIGNENEGTESSSGAVQMGSYFIAIDDYLQVGPEQILARIPAKSMNKNWKDTESSMWMAESNFNPDVEMMTT